LHDLVIRNAKIARQDGSLLEGDLACREGRISAISSSIPESGKEEADAKGLILMPGVIDPQVHFRDPGASNKEDLGSGSRAAVRGGVTSFLDMPNTRPTTTTHSALEAKLQRASRICVANYGFFIGATPDNLDVLNTAAPVCGIKIFMGASTGDLLVDKEHDLDRIFSSGSRLIAVHAEDEERIQERMALFLGQQSSRYPPSLHSEIRDPKCALIATERALNLSQRYGRRLHILHLSTAEEVTRLRQGKPSQVTAEALPNHLFLTTDDYDEQGSRVQMNPPIRRPGNEKALWAGLKEGVLDIIATDHAPHTLEEKSSPYPASPSGMPGVEISLPLMLTAMSVGRCTLQEILKWMCQGPAEVYGIPNKGIIGEGYDADLTLVDIDNIAEVRDENVWSRAGWSPFSGRSLTGWPQITIVGGQIVYDHGTLREGVTGSALSFNQTR
jgi:dihydroorotase